MCIASSSTQKEEDSRRRQRLLKYYSAFSKSKKLAFFKVVSEAVLEELRGISSLKSLTIRESEKLKEIPE